MQTLTNTKLTTKGERTREHILDHALRLFIDQGYDETTIDFLASDSWLLL
jgi:AcrR family transcriptional regulator